MHLRLVWAAANAAAFALVAALAAQPAAAAFIEATLAGHYDDTGSFLGGTPPTTENYSVGYIIDAALPDTDPDKIFVRRNYFLFDLASLSGTASSATLVLPLGGYISDMAMEEYTITSSIFSPSEIADPFGSGVPGGSLEVFASLGMAGLGGQIEVGSAVIVEADIVGMGTAFELFIPLDLAFFNAAIGTDLVLGGRLFDDEEPENLPPVTIGSEDERILFAFTNPNEAFVDSPLGATVRPRIEFEIVPEPSTAVLVFGGLALTAARRRARG